MTKTFDEITTVLEGHISDYVRDFDPSHEPTGINVVVGYLQVVNLGLKGLQDVEVSDTALRSAIQSFASNARESLTFLSMVLMMAKLATLKDKEVDE